MSIRSRTLGAFVLVLLSVWGIGATAVVTPAAADPASAPGWMPEEPPPLTAEQQQWLKPLDGTDEDGDVLASLLVVGRIRNRTVLDLHARDAARGLLKALPGRTVLHSAVFDDLGLPNDLLVLTVSEGRVDGHGKPPIEELRPLDPPRVDVSGERS